MKILSVIEKFIKSDRVTAMKEFFYYVRILIEVFIEEDFSDEVIFENEWGGIVYYDIQYEWKFIQKIYARRGWERECGGRKFIQNKYYKLFSGDLERNQWIFWFLLYNFLKCCILVYYWEMVN